MRRACTTPRLQHVAQPRHLCHLPAEALRRHEHRRLELQRAQRAGLSLGREILEERLEQVGGEHAGQGEGSGFRVQGLWLMGQG